MEGEKTNRFIKFFNNLNSKHNNKITDNKNTSFALVTTLQIVKLYFWISVNWIIFVIQVFKGLQISAVQLIYFLVTRLTNLFHLNGLAN